MVTHLDEPGVPAEQREEGAHDPWSLVIDADAGKRDVPPNRESGESNDRQQPPEDAHVSPEERSTADE
jgi:hypothetical protein